MNSREKRLFEGLFAKLGFSGKQGVRRTKRVLVSLVILFSVPIVALSQQLVPVGNKGYKNDGVEPDRGTSLTDFVFRIEYIDRDGFFPEYVLAHIDTNNDNFISSNEVFTMSLERGDEPKKGLVFARRMRLSYHIEGTNDLIYYFSTKTKDNRTALSGQFSGPQITPVLRFSLSRGEWDTGDEREPMEVVTMTPEERILIKNTGDGVENFALAIDTTERSFWLPAEKRAEIAEDRYLLSAIFTKPNETDISEQDFNELGDEDVITLDLKRAHGPVFGRGNISYGEKLFPEEETALWLSLVMPSASRKNYGNTEKIIIKVVCLGE